MDTNLKEVLLVILGAAVSLFGTVITLTFELRRDRWVAQREQRKEEYKELIIHHRSLAALSTALQILMINAKREVKIDNSYFSENIQPRIDQYKSSPLYGLPPILMTKDQKIIDMLTKLFPFESSINQVVINISSGIPVNQEMLNSLSRESVDMNLLIAEILKAAEKQI